MKRHKYRAFVATLDDVPEGVLVSVDPDFTYGELLSAAVAHNSGVTDISRAYWFGHKDDYPHAPSSAPAIYLQEVADE